MPQPRSSNESSDSTPVAADFTGPFLSVAFSSDGSGVAGAQDLSDEASASMVDRAGVDTAVTATPPGGGSSITLCTGHEVSLAWEKNGNRLACAFTELHAPNAPEQAGADEGPSFRDWQNLTGNSKNTTLVSAIQIFTFGGKSPTRKNVFTGLGYSIEPKNIAWSPDGSRMAFEGWRLRGEGQRELSGIAVQRLDADSGDGVRVDPTHLEGFRYLLPTSAAGKPQNPKWSADSMHLLFEMVKPDGKRDLWSINADGTNAINLTKGVGDNFDGAWSTAK
jgi:Tol biopolymer transport system component